MLTNFKDTKDTLKAVSRHLLKIHSVTNVFGSVSTLGLTLTVSKRLIKQEQQQQQQQNGVTVPEKELYHNTDTVHQFYSS